MAISYNCIKESKFKKEKKVFNCDISLFTIPKLFFTQFTVCNSVFIVSLSNFYFDFHFHFDTVSNVTKLFLNFCKFISILVQISSFSALEHNKTSENGNKLQLFRIMLIFN